MTQQFEPFQKILVRDYDNQKWRCGFFSNIIDGGTQFRYRATEGDWQQCIPYEGNEHLLGTADSPTPPEPEFKFGDKVEVSDDYKNWQKAIYMRHRNVVPSHAAMCKGENRCKFWNHCRKADW